MGCCRVCADDHHDVGVHDAVKRLRYSRCYERRFQAELANALGSCERELRMEFDPPALASRTPPDAAVAECRQKNKTLSTNCKPSAKTAFNVSMPLNSCRLFFLAAIYLFNSKPSWLPLLQLARFKTNKTQARLGYVLINA